MARRLGGWVCALVLWACPGFGFSPSPVPQSWLKAPLQGFKPPPLLEDLQRWAPQEPAVAFLSLMNALLGGLPPRRELLLSLDSLASALPHEAMVGWAASRQWVRTGLRDDTLRAIDRARQAREADAGNALLDIWLARLLARSGQVHAARMLFFESHAFSRADGYGPRRETWMLRALHKAGRVNALTMAEAIGFFTEVNPFELSEDLDVLHEVFLEPLNQHPYDIRRRAPEAALRLVWTGQMLRRQSLSAPGLLWSGLEERALGYAFEAKGWEFLAGFGEAFARPALLQMAHAGLLRLQLEAGIVLAAAGRQWSQALPSQFLSAWQILGEDEQLTLGEALKHAESQPYWHSVLRHGALQHQALFAR
jgi:hypothetical protein